MMEKMGPPRSAVGWVLTKRAAARGRGLQSHAAAAGGLLQVAGAGVDYAIGAAHRVPADAASAGAATAGDCHPLLRNGHRTSLFRGPAWRARRSCQGPGNSKLPTWPSPLPGPGMEKSLGARTTLHRVETMPGKP